MDEKINEILEYKEEMKSLINDLMLRVRKLENVPREEQVSIIMDKIESDKARLDKIAHFIGGQILLDFNMFASDLNQYLKVPDDRSAYPQLADDAAILLNALSNH
ncbi:MAG: hypothetical protein WDZ28_02755 [Simkaniaceae bacterium]